MQTSILFSFKLTIISPLPPGCSTSSMLLPSALSTSWRSGLRKCSRCHPTRSLAGVDMMLRLVIVRKSDVMR